MIKKLPLLAVIAIAICLFNNAIAQTVNPPTGCSGTVSNGQNLITNGDFSDGYSGWTHDPAYNQYTSCANCYSVPGDIYVGTTPTDFNHAFTNFPSQDPSSPNFLMVDGVCQLGIDLWNQNNIPIAPNTNYYFSVWITSLDNFTPRGTLQFSINGTPLDTVITASGSPGTWKQVTAVWYSGLTPPATATISIQNTTTTGCNTAVDFAIDDITFTPGCNFGGAGPTPDLGPDFAICGRALPFNINPGFDAATQANPNIIYTWYENGVAVVSGSGPSYYNFSVNAAGNYSVCVDSAGSCPKTDILNINSNYSINLGPNLTLCNPTTATLNPGYSGAGVTYQWYDNGSAISGATNQTYTLNTPGNYSVAVHDPSCGNQTASVQVTTNAATPVNGTFCTVANGGTGTAQLSVTGPGKYKWWSAPTGGTALARGSTYTTPVLPGPGPYTYYVQDTSTFVASAGPASNSGFTNLQNTGPGDSKNVLIFNALTSFVLDSITVYPYNYYCGTGTMNVINFIVIDSAGNTVGTSNYSTPCTGTGQPTGPLQVPVGISVPQGNGYQLKLNSGSNNIALYLNSTGSNGNQPVPELYQYPTTYDNAVEFVANSSKDFNLYYSPDAFPGYFNWVITHGINCSMVPVIASAYCPVCTAAKPADSATASVSKFCTGSTANITLTVHGGSGDTLVWYSDSCGGIRVASNATGANVVVPAPSKTTTYYARWESSINNCYATCASVTVTPVTPPTPAVAGKDSSICNGVSYTLNGNVPKVGTGVWTVVSGTGTLTNANSATSQVTGIGAGDLVLKWTISNSPCPDTSSEVTIHRDTLTAPAIAGATFKPCDSTKALSYFVKPYDNKVTFSWTTGNVGSLTITSGTTNDTVTVNVGSANDTLKLLTQLGACSLDTIQVIKSVPPPTPAVAGKDSSICDATTFTLYGNVPTAGKGVWTVVSGTGTFTNDSSATSQVTGIGVGDLVLKWTISNSPCPDTSSEVTIHRDTLTAPAIAGANFKPCDSTKALNYVVNPYDSKVAFSWTTGNVGSLTITSGTTNDTVTVNVGSANDTLKVLTQLGACRLDTFQLIKPVPPPTPAVAGKDSSICDATSFTLYGNVPTAGKGVWTVVSGTGTFTNDSSATSQVTGIGVGDLILKWTISNSPCPDTSSEVTIHRDTLTAPVIAGATFKPCDSTKALSYVVKPYDNKVAFSWTTGTIGSLTIASGTTNDTVTVNIGSANDTLKVLTKLGACSLDTSQVIAPVPPPTQAVAGKDSSICNGTTYTLNGNVPTVGKGVWTVVSGTGTFTNDSSATSQVTDVGVGDLVLKWTISNSPCPVTDSSVTIHRDTLTASVIAGSTFMPCDSTTGLSYIATPYNSNFHYGWQVGGTGSLKIVSRGTNDTVGINVGSLSDTLYVLTNYGVCSLKVSQLIAPVPPPTPAVAGKNTSICNSTIYGLNGNVPIAGKGVWSVVSGIGTLADDSSATSQVTGIGVGDLVLKWTISNSPCPDTTSQVTIHRDTLSYPIIAGSNFLPCSSSTNLNYSVANFNPDTGYHYQWGTGRSGSLKITSGATNDSVKVSIGTMADTLFLTETSFYAKSCMLTVDTTVNLAPNISLPNVASLDDTTCINSFYLSALLPTVGSGKWSISSGSGTFANDSNITYVTGLVKGINVFKWTVTGCGGPLYDSVVVDVLNSDLAMKVTSPADTQCFGVKRQISVVVSPSQGHYNYVWDNVTAKSVDTTSQPNLYITPETDSVVFYVYAYDTLHCLSNIDTIVVHATPKQDLFFPNIITPNGDDHNDVFKVAEQGGHGTPVLPGATLDVFNRWGDRVFEAKNYPYTSGNTKQWWDGTGAVDGTYFYYLQTGCGNNSYKGWVEVVR